jgi:hypothetical protein
MCSNYLVLERMNTLAPGHWLLHISPSDRSSPVSRRTVLLSGIPGTAEMSDD